MTSRLPARLLCAILLVGALSLAPRSIAQSDQDTMTQAAFDQVVDNTTKEVLKKINDGLVQRLGLAAKSTPLADHPYRFVFLVNTAQATWNKMSVRVVRDSTRRILKRLETYPLRDRAKAVDPSDHSYASVFPYERDLYVEAMPGLYTTIYRDHRLDRPEDADGAADAMPENCIPKRADGVTPYVSIRDGQKDGHDSVTTRDELMQLEPPLRDGLPTIIIQFTTNDLDQSGRGPKPKSDYDSGDFTTAGYEQYGRVSVDFGTPKDTQTAFFWIYGPARLSNQDLRPWPARIDGTRHDGDHRDASFPWPILVIAGIAIVAAVIFLSRGVNLTVDGTPLVIKRGQKVRIVASTTSAGAGKTVSLTAGSSRNAPPGVLADVCYAVGSVDVVVKPQVCSVSLGDGTPKTLVVLKRGSASNKVKLSHPSGYQAIIEIKVS